MKHRLVAVGKRVTPLRPHRSRRALQAHRAAGASAGPLLRARGLSGADPRCSQDAGGDLQATFEGLRARGYPETMVERAREGLKKGAEIFAPFVVLLWREARCSVRHVESDDLPRGSRTAPLPHARQASNRRRRPMR